MPRICVLCSRPSLSFPCSVWNPYSSQIRPPELILEFSLLLLVLLLEYFLEMTLKSKPSFEVFFFLLLLFFISKNIVFPSVIFMISWFFFTDTNASSYLTEDVDILSPIKSSQGSVFGTCRAFPRMAARWQPAPGKPRGKANRKHSPWIHELPPTMAGVQLRGFFGAHSAFPEQGLPSSCWTHYLFTRSGFRLVPCCTRCPCYPSL